MAGDGAAATSSSSSSSSSTSTNSHAALCTLHIQSKLTYEQDWLLQMICQYIQLKTVNQLIIRTVDGNKMSNSNNSNDNSPTAVAVAVVTPYYLTMGGGYSTATSSSTTSATTTPRIVERNAILRQLLGIALHGAMDITSSSNSTSTGNKFPQLYWTGGYCMTNASCHASSVKAMANHAYLMHYMTLASQLYNSTTSAVTESAIQEINNTLQTTSFLLPYASTPSIADFDVAIALLTQQQLEDILFSNHHEYKSLQRWLIHMVQVIQQLSQFTNIVVPSSTNNKMIPTNMEWIQQKHGMVPSSSSSSSSSSNKAKTPLTPITTFFNGTEGTVKDLLSKLHGTTATTTTTTTTTTTNNNKKKQQGTVSNAMQVTQEKGNDNGDNNNDDSTGKGTVTSKKKVTKQDKKEAAKKAKELADSTATEGNVETKTAAATAKATPSTTTTTTTTDTTFDVRALDIRIGQIVKIWEHETADKLYCEEIDFGNGDIRQIASGLRPFYKNAQTDLLHQYVCVVYNLKKRTLVGFPSHGMVLCASNHDHTSVEIICPPNPTSQLLGERITFDGLDPTTIQPENENKVAKKKIFECIAPDLHTNVDGIVMWKDHAASCSTGPITAIHKMSNAKVS